MDPVLRIAVPSGAVPDPLLISRIPSRPEISIGLAWQPSGAVAQLVRAADS
jgi:hypothetical protein